MFGKSGGKRPWRGCHLGTGDTVAPTLYRRSCAYPATVAWVSVSVSDFATKGSMASFPLPADISIMSLFT